MDQAVLDPVVLNEAEAELQLSDDDLESLDPQWNLQERHAAILRALAKLGVDVTGHNRFRRPALSIEDVDVLLSRLMGRYGVVSDYEFAMDEDARPLVSCVSLDKAAEEGVYERWEVTVVSIVRDTRPKNGGREEERRVLFDVGSNPSAAVSFALKRHKRELYHLGAIKEGVSDEQPRESRGRSRRDLKTTACPLCGVVGALGWSQRKAAYYCATAEGGCGEEFPDLMAKPEVSDGRREAVQKLMAFGNSSGGDANGRRRGGAPIWPEAKVKARIKLLASTTNGFEQLTEPEWNLGVAAVRDEIVKEHRQWCGAECAHVREWER